MTNIFLAQVIRMIRRFRSARKKLGVSGTLNKIETFKINQMISNKLQDVV